MRRQPTNVQHFIARSKSNADEVRDDVTFATKPAQARVMIKRAVATGMPSQWVTANEVYCSDYRFCRTLDYRFCRTLEDAGLSYVVAVSRTQKMWVDFQQVRRVVARIVFERRRDPREVLAWSDWRRWH